MPHTVRRSMRIKAPKIKVKVKVKRKFIITRASATSAFGRRSKKRSRNIIRSNPTVKISPSPPKKIEVKNKTLQTKNNNQNKIILRKKIIVKKMRSRILPRRQEKSKVQTIRSGSGKFTRAIDVGGGKMQDVVFTFSQGKITNRKFLGKPVPQSRRFKEKRMK